MPARLGGEVLLHGANLTEGERAIELRINGVPGCRRSTPWSSPDGILALELLQQDAHIDRVSSRWAAAVGQQGWRC